MVFSWSSFSYPSVFPFKSLVFICWVSSWCNVSRLSFLVLRFPYVWIFSNYLQPWCLTVLTGLNNVVNGSNIQWRGKSYAASVPSDAPKSQRGRRLPRDERKAMVESFVNKYLFFLIYFFISSLNSYIKLYSHHDYFLDWLFLRV